MNYVVKAACCKQHMEQSEAEAAGESEAAGEAGGGCVRQAAGQAWWGRARTCSPS
jgi:hypothetical protein